MLFFRAAFALAFVSMLGVALISAAAQATTITGYTSDADFLANANFVKDFGGNVRWGNGAANGDWEYSVVDANDIPTGAGNPKQHDWLDGPSTNSHTVSFDYDGGTTISLDPGLPAGVSVDTSFAVGSIDTLAIRARANPGDGANLLSPITITFDLGGPDVVLGALSGDSDAEYIVVIDSRFAGGFELIADAEIMDGNGSLPQYGFKVGSTVPEPGLALLLGVGAGALAFRRRR